jgi:AcrR family transcriptional regulator
MRQQIGVIRTRESRAEHTRKLLQAAYDLIPEVGIAGLRTRDIAKKADVHLATFHYCFESKNALLTGLYADIFEKYKAAIDRFITPNEDIESRLEGHRQLRRYLMIEDPNLLIAWKAFTGAIWTDPVVNDIVRSGYRQLRYRLSGYDCDGPDTTRIPALADVKPSIASAIILAVFAGSLTQMWMDPEELPIEEYEEGLRMLYGIGIPGKS